MIRINSLNPIKLIDALDSSIWYGCYAQTCFNQPFNIGDITKLQLESNSQINITHAYIVDIKGRLLKSLNVSYPDVGIVGKYVAEVNVDFSNLSHGICYIKIVATDADGGYVFTSNELCLAQSHENSVLLAYSNSENTQNVYFYEGLQFALRTLGGFIPKSFKPNSDDTSYVNQNVDTLLLKSTPYDTFNFIAGGKRGIPDWFQSIINRIFCCDTILIDGVSFIKIDGAKWQPTANNLADLRAWTIEVGFAKNVFGKEFQPSTVRAVWENYICQRQTLPLDYAFVFAINDNTELLHSSAVLGESVIFDIISLESGVFIGDIAITNDIQSWATVTLQEIPEQNIIKATVVIAQNSDAARNGNILFKQQNSNEIITLNISQAAGSYPMLLNVKEQQNVLASTLELVLDNGNIISQDFVGTQLKTVHIATQRKINTVRLLVQHNTNINVADVAILAKPSYELNMANNELQLPIDRNYMPIPAIDSNGSNELDIQITPKIPAVVAIKTEISYQASNNGFASQRANVGIRFTSQITGNPSQYYCYLTAKIKYAVYDSAYNIVSYGTYSMPRTQVWFSTAYSCTLPNAIPLANAVAVEIIDLQVEPIAGITFEHISVPADFNLHSIIFTQSLDLSTNEIVLAWQSDMPVTTRYPFRLEGEMTFLNAGEPVGQELISDSSKTIYDGSGSTQSGEFRFSWLFSETFDDAFFNINFIYLENQYLAPTEGHALAYVFTFWS